MINAVDLGVGHRNDSQVQAYYGIAPSAFRDILTHWGQQLSSTEDLADYTFVDLGAGKGRAVLLASEFPFAETIGVELNDQLARVARDNIATWSAAGRAHGPLKVIEQDATEFAWPLTPLVAYIFNPFGPKVLEAVLDNLLRSFREHSRPIYILYVSPSFHAAIDRDANVKLLWSRAFPFSEADQLVDAFENTELVCNAYRLGTRRSSSAV